MDGFLPLTPPPKRPDITLAVCRGVLRLFVDLGLAPITEMTLGNGRRADVIGLGPKGDIVIAEVKSGFEDFRVDGKWPDYQPFCDQFYFAVGPGFPTERLPDGPGVIVADEFGGSILKLAPRRSLAPARRKALTLGFARLAAGRFLRAPGQPYIPSAGGAFREDPLQGPAVHVETASGL